MIDYAKLKEHLKEGDRLKNYKVVQIWPGRFVCKQVTVCPDHILTTLYKYSAEETECKQPIQMIIVRKVHRQWHVRAESLLYTELRLPVNTEKERHKFSRFPSFMGSSRKVNKSQNYVRLSQRAGADFFLLR
jgi:hypothetical protein